MTDGINVTLKQLSRYSQYKARLLIARQNAKAPLAGSHLSKMKGRGMEFDEVRHYQAGDDIRTIDWRVTAKTGKPHTKLFREERERPVFLLLDLSPSMYFGSQLMLKAVQACHLLALLGWNARHRGDRVGGLLFGAAGHRELRPKGQQSGIQRLLHQAVELHQQNLALRQGQCQSLTQSLIKLRRLTHTGSQVVLISDFSHFDQDAVKQLALLRRHNEVSAWQITDPLELDLPQTRFAGSLPVTDGEQRGYLRPGRKLSRTEYHRYAEQRQSDLLHHFSRYGISLQQISSATPLVEQLFPESA